MKINLLRRDPSGERRPTSKRPSTARPDGAENAQRMWSLLLPPGLAGERVERSANRASQR
jgi:hypothetical protein